MKDYYSLLGIESTATEREIKKNYRLLAVKYHPDKNPDPDAASKFIEISEAYEILSNKKSRTKYDLYRWQLLKQKEEKKQASSDSFIVVTPPQSTRNRRNKEQKARSTKYHQSKDEQKKFWLLVMESLHIASRYIFHLLGITLFTVILFPALGHQFIEFGKNIFRGILIGALTVPLAYSIYWMGKNFITEFNKDLEAFSVFYKIPQKKAANVCISVVAIVLVIYFAALFYLF